MSAEDNINMLKRIQPLSNFEKKRKFRSTIMLVVATFVSILFFVYAYLQKLEADKQAASVQELRVEAEALRSEAENQRLAAEKAKELAILAQQEAERQRMLAEQALADCKGNKRK